MRRLFLSVAEHSADRYGAELARAAKARWPGVELVGLAGPLMQAAGVAPLLDFTQNAAMLGGVWKLLGRGRGALTAAQAVWKQARPDAVVVMDSTLLHLPMAERAKRCGLPVIYYVSPQTWASRASRNRKLARDCDHVACILPFEEGWLRGAGVNATYVGHPLVWATERARAASCSKIEGAAGDVHRVAILPGSREGLIRRMLPILLQVARRMSALTRKPIEFRVSCFSERREPLFRELIQQAGVPLEIVTGEIDPLLEWCELALTASGTATVEVALRRRPMVVLYDVGQPLRALYPIGGSFVLRTTHLSLVNILAGRRIVPEFMPIVRDAEGPARVAAELLRDDAWRRTMVDDLEAVVSQLKTTVNPAERVCDLIEQAVERK